MTAQPAFVNVVVHGLFFMWLNPTSKLLELIAPKVDASPIASKRHRLLGGIRGALQPLSGVVDWSNIGLVGKAPTSPSDGLKPSILQFSMTDTSLGGWETDPGLYSGRIILPWPLEFYPLRCDDFDTTFIYDSPSVVGDNIKDRCKHNNTRIGLITCLRYERTPDLPFPLDKNIHCYFQPCVKHDIDEVNDDLTQAGNCFKNNTTFDLRMAQRAGNVHTPRGGHCPAPVPGADVDDDYSLDEDPLAIQLCSSPFENDREKKPRKRNVNPANCPNFYVFP